MSKTNIDVLIGGPKNKHSYIYKEVILKENFPLSQQMVEKNRKYVIKWNFDLNGETVTVPENCILEFDGGSISNGTLVGQDTVLIYHQELEDAIKYTHLDGTFIYRSGAGTPDDTTIELKDNKLQVKNGGIHGIHLNADVVDDEDIHLTTDNKLQFKDRPNTDGMGRKILRKNIVDGVNTLTQDMMSDANTIYVIQYDFTLIEDITVPTNCVLKFDGGSISGAYTITGANTGVQAGLVKIINTDVTLAGTWSVADAYPEWFGAKGDGVADDYLALKKCLYGFKILNLVKDNRYKIINPNELDAAFYLYSNYKINGNNATIAFGYTDNFCPLFVTVLNSSNIVVKNLQIDWVGDIENYTVKEYINDSNCIFALRGTKKSLFSNIKCSSSVDKPYVAFAKALGGAFENTIFEDIILSHYNFGFVQGMHYMTIRNVKGTKRSNVCDNPNKVYNVGATHLVYLAGEGVVLTDVTEEGDLLDESISGFSGATVQVQAGENIVIQNIVTKMKNTGALNLKRAGSHKNNIIENVVCDCSDWDFDTFSDEWTPVIIVTYQDDNSYGLIINNVTVNIADKLMKAVQLAGEHITVSNCIITASGNQNNTVLNLATLYNSRIDVKIFNSDAYKQGISVSNITDNRVDIYSNCDIIVNLDEGRGANRNNLFASNNDRMIQLVGTIRDNTVVYPKRTWEIADAPAGATSYTKNFLFAGTTGAYLIYFSYGAFNQINTDALIMNLDLSGGNKTCDIRHISHMQRYQGFIYNREIVLNSITSQGCNMTINVSGNRAIDYINFKIIKL